MNLPIISPTINPTKPQFTIKASTPIMQTNSRRLALLLPFLLGPAAQAAEQTVAGVQTCPSSPNCVSSNPLTDDDHHVLPFRIEGSPTASMEQLRQALLAEAGLRIVEDTGTLIRAQATSKLFHFVDDLVFQLDPEKRVIQVRSASRVGYWDMGVNRKRIETLRQKIAQTSLAKP